MISDPECLAKGNHIDLSAQSQKERAIQKVITAISHLTNPWRTANKEGRLHTELSWLRINKVFFQYAETIETASTEDNNMKFLLQHPRGS